MSDKASKIIHAAKIHSEKIGQSYLFLRELDAFRYVWFWEKTYNNEIETPVWGGTPVEAILEGKKVWKLEEFRLIHCGFRYTLPERDEVGSNALFHQMVDSYLSMNGVYFDEELGGNCIVQNVSQEARNLYKRKK